MKRNKTPSFSRPAPQWNGFGPCYLPPFLQLMCRYFFNPLWTSTLLVGEGLVHFTILLPTFSVLAVQLCDHFQILCWLLSQWCGLYLQVSFSLLIHRCVLLEEDSPLALLRQCLPSPHLVLLPPNSVTCTFMLLKGLSVPFNCTLGRVPHSSCCPVTKCYNINK